MIKLNNCIRISDLKNIAQNNLLILIHTANHLFRNINWWNNFMVFKALIKLPLKQLGTFEDLTKRALDDIEKEGSSSSVVATLI